MFRVTRKEEIFFDLFVEIMDYAGLAATKLNDLINHYEDVDAKIEQIKTIEHECDQVFHTLMRQLNKSFVTPIDREDINVIARDLDNITDTIEDVAHSFRMFNIVTVREEAKALAALIEKSTDELKILMGEMKHMKTSKVLSEKVIEVNRLENEGDDIYRKSMTSLFSGEVDTLEVIKWKQIYEFLENSLDACEEVANTVEGVVMKHA